MTNAERARRIRNNLASIMDDMQSLEDVGFDVRIGFDYPHNSGYKLRPGAINLQLIASKVTKETL